MSDEREGPFELTAEQEADLAESIAEADRGEWPASARSSASRLIHYSCPSIRMRRPSSGTMRPRSATS